MTEMTKTTASTVPPGWTYATLGDISEDIANIDPRNSPNRIFDYLDIQSIDNRTMRIADPKRILGAKAPMRARQLVRSGDILFSTVRTYLRNIAYVDQKYDGQVASTGFCVVRVSQGICPRFIFRYMQTDKFLSPLSAMQRGVVYPAVRDRDVFSSIVPVPPLAEQRRIADRLDHLLEQFQDVRETVMHVPQLARQFRLSLLAKTFRSEPTSQSVGDEPNERRACFPLDEQWQHRRDGTVPFPVEWKWVKLRQLGRVERGKFSHRPRNDPRFYGGTMPFIQTGDIARSGGCIASYSQTLNERGLSVSKMFPRGTVVVSIAANIGDAAVLGFDSCFPDSIVGIVVNPELSTPDYVCYVMQAMQSELSSIAPATAQKNINLRILDRLLIPLPPLDEQNRIVRRLRSSLNFASETDSLVELIKTRFDVLRESLLTEAYRGRLVSQDPGDEPASVYLERVSKQKSKDSEKIFERTDS